MKKILGYVGSFIRLIFIVPLMFIVFIALILVVVCILLGDFINSITGYNRGKNKKTMLDKLESMITKRKDYEVRR